MEKNAWFLFALCTEKCGIPWKVCAVSIRGVVAKEPEHKQKVQESPSFWPKSQGLLQIVQSMIWEGHGCSRVTFFFS